MDRFDRPREIPNVPPRKKAGAWFLYPREHRDDYVEKLDKRLEKLEEWFQKQIDQPIVRAAGYVLDYGWFLMRAGDQKRQALHGYQRFALQPKNKYQRFAFQFSTQADKEASEARDRAEHNYAWTINRLEEIKADLQAYKGELSLKP